MKKTEVAQIVVAMIILAAVISFSGFFDVQKVSLNLAVIFAVLIIGINIIAKKVVAHLLDASVEHELWRVTRFGWKPHQYFSKPVPAGAIVPLFFTIFSLGIFKIMTFLTYHTGTLKERAAKRFGYYSYTEMTEWHNGLIGATGIVAVLLLSLVSYFIGGNDSLWRLAAYYAFWNMIPLSTLDGTQIFFGSRTLYSTLAIITLLFTSYAFLLS